MLLFHALDIVKLIWMVGLYFLSLSLLQKRQQFCQKTFSRGKGTREGDLIKAFIFPFTSLLAI